MAGVRVLRRRLGGLGMAFVLRQRGRGRSGGEEEQGQALHAASPSIGRILTMRIMPACMW
jgi:hypothetical protein